MRWMLLLLAGCVLRVPGAPPPETPVERVVPVRGPPFSAAALRAGLPVGATRTFALSDSEGLVHERWEVVESGPTEVRFSFSDPDPGSETGWAHTSARTFTWVELTDHARFPEGTTLKKDKVSVGAGTWTTWHYTVPRGEGRVEDYWFATELPGPPVLMTGAVEGVETDRMELVEPP